MGLLLSMLASAENWPQFRGPTGQGESSGKALPIIWSSTQNIAWKTPIPGTGWSSPIVWGDRVFVTSATENGASCHVLCVDRKSGKILWDTQVFNQTPTRKEGMNSWATPTPSTDGQKVYAIFGEGGIAAVTFDGKVAWTNLDNHFYSRHGLGASPAIYKDLLIQNFDGSTSDPHANELLGWQIPWDQGYVLALDTDTGKQRWKTFRGKSRIGHTLPRFVEVDGKTQLISTAGDVVEGLDPETGRKIWWAFNEGETPVPSPVIGDGLLFTSPGFGAKSGPALRCWRLGGQGDVTKTNLVWQTKKGVPTIPSYLFHDHRLYAMKEDGVLQCFEAATGKLLWKHRLEGTRYEASPVYADGKIYLLDEDAMTMVIDAGPTFKSLALNPLGGHCQASMAVSNGHFFIRTKDQLWCIGAGK
ncbi:MAG TPA: PQQ-binding-like beta-propeller repeat protein [Tepidisphaeraceae bacterium]|nr:PQQ-binding-like beta-propeller repeat protein [Tepidisphaeraceae bacterium]